MLSWNVRGLNTPNKQKEVKLLCTNENICLVNLLETKVKTGNMEKVINNMFGGWKYITNLDHHYNGRVVVAWRPDYYQVKYISGTAQSITGLVTDVVLQKEFYITVVYAFNTREERRSLWQHLESMSGGIKQPWLVTGDFNSVLLADDRIGGNPVTICEVVDFQECIDTCELMELPCGGSRYTWNDNMVIIESFQRLTGLL
ncbi:uncharacterized protein LOC142178570 [Nicotiana tabacum]|uniref:Uncharacterized protein LOC142178570 n=1 Tax=Nicotiana tabacum TaxID=4097 RepID=A0AC58U4V7_TOBAC